MQSSCRAWKRQCKEEMANVRYLAIYLPLEAPSKPTVDQHLIIILAGPLPFVPHHTVERPKPAFPRALQSAFSGRSLSLYLCLSLSLCVCVCVVCERVRNKRSL